MATQGRLTTSNQGLGLWFEAFPVLLFWGDAVTRMRAKILSLLLLNLAALLLAGCPHKESIAKINQDPARFAGKEISIAGQVTDSFGAMGTGVFQLDDGTGTMWVYSKGYGVPGGGAKVAVTGVIEQGFAFGGRNFATILRETESRH
jgi:hypothetical protein